jgi:hypothetical protein
MLRLLPLLFLLVQPAKPAPSAQADAFCGQLRALSEAANREGSLDRLARSGFRPGPMRSCQANYAGGSASISCFQNLAPASFEPAQLGPRIARCLPTGRLEPPPAWPNQDIVFRDGRLRVTMTSRCDERCKAGRSARITYAVEPVTAN